MHLVLPLKLGVTLAWEEEGTLKRESHPFPIRLVFWGHWAFPRGGPPELRFSDCIGASGLPVRGEERLTVQPQAATRAEFTRREAGSTSGRAEVAARSGEAGVREETAPPPPRVDGESTSPELPPHNRSARGEAAPTPGKAGCGDEGARDSVTKEIDLVMVVVWGAGGRRERKEGREGHRLCGSAAGRCQAVEIAAAAVGM
jgi:hypothetical protein